MLNFLLEASGSLPVGYKKIGIGEAALDALLGFIVVFIGIAFLVGLLWLIGFAVRKINGAPAKKKEEKAAEKIEEPAISEKTSADELSEETVAVITAAIMAYYAKENPKCEFTVKRIKRI